jgi:hypothetical protein
VKRPLEVLRGGWSAVAGQSERTILLGTVLLASAMSLATGFVLAQYYSVDAVSSLLVFVPDDCYLDWPTKVGRHCFSDYSITVSVGMMPNPWDPFPLYLPPDFKPTHFNYTAAAMVPHTLFGYLGKWLAAPRLGLLGYLVVLTIAVFAPAVWAARGARGLERVVVFVACGALAVPAWVVIDRGNSVGFLAPIGLIFLVALCRRRWGLVTVMVVLAALVKPQFVVLAAALFVARQWRSGGIAVAGAVIGNLAAYALWPRDFPRTITESLNNTFGYGNGGTRAALVANSNVSLGKALLMIPDGIEARATGGTIPDDFLAGARPLMGYAVLVLVLVCLMALGRRIPPVMAGIVLLAVASLFAPLTNPYYLIFVLPVAALVVRDPLGPPGTGIFDQSTVGAGRRVVGWCVSLATALCIAQIALPSAPQRVGANGAALVVTSTVSLAPILWLVACGAIIVSYARRPAPSRRGDQGPAAEVPPDDADATPGASEPITEFSPQRPA